MSDVIVWIAAEAERPEIGAGVELSQRRRARDKDLPADRLPPERVRAEHLAAHQFPGKGAAGEEVQREVVPPEVEQPQANQLELDQPEEDRPEEDQQSWHARLAAEEDRERERRTYRGRTVAMLRRYMRYSIETGRLPSLLGREFFRAKVTAYTVVTFEDRVIFVHDMEKCLERLDEFSRQLIARHILQEHDQAATGKLLHCTERTVRTYVPVVLDLLSEILIEVGLIERIESSIKNSCQGGKSDPITASDCEDGKYKF